MNFAVDYLKTVKKIVNNWSEINCWGLFLLLKVKPPPSFRPRFDNIRRWLFNAFKVDIIIDCGNAVAMKPLLKF